MQTLTRDEIAARVIRVIGDHLDNPPEAILETDDLRDKLGADILDMVEMVMSMEVEFDSIEFADLAWNDVTTVGSAIDLVVATLSAAGRAIAAVEC